MKLPKFFEKSAPSEHYLALILRNEKVTSVIFEKIGNTIKYINSDEEYFSNTVEDAETEEFLDRLDKVITRAESALPENVETHKTLFGLKESWIENDKIKKDYLDKLKLASNELSLEPIGFLGFTESIINLVQKEEGAPITAVLADIGKKYITVSLVRAGKIIETKSSEIHQSASYTVDTLLKHFQTPEVMPARIIILDSEEDELTQEFIGHSWSKSLLFLHIPQILSLPEDASVKAMLLGAATKMGGHLVYDRLREDGEKLPQKVEEVGEETSIKEIEKPEKEKTENLEKLDYVGEEKSLEYFGFLEGADIAKEARQEKPIKREDLEEVTGEKIDEIPEEVKEEVEKKTPLPAIVALTFSKLKNTVSKVLPFLSKIKLNRQTLKNFSSNRKFLAVGGLILFLAVLFLAFNILGKSATVDILVSAREDQKDSSVTFSESSSTDIENAVISVSSISVEEEGSATIKTTGKEDVGDKAKGTVTIFNNGDSSVTFASGTTITSSNSLTFKLDSSVTVASSSGDIFSGTKPGTANVNVTASSIGQEYNLPSGTKFTIGSNSDVAAKNDNAFSGGTKKSVTVVSEEDLAKLLEELPKSLEDKAKEDIKGKIQDGRQILSTFTDKSIESKSFDKKEGEQAQSVTIKGSVKFTTVSYSNKDIESFASNLFNSEDSKVSAKNLEVTGENIGLEKNGDVTADITIKAKIFPKIDSTSLSKEIAGNSLQKSKNLILNIEQVKSVEINLSPNIPFLSKNLPSNPNKIKINVFSA